MDFFTKKNLIIAILVTILATISTLIIISKSSDKQNQYQKTAKLLKDFETRLNQYDKETMNSLTSPCISMKNNAKLEDAQIYLNRLEKWKNNRKDIIDIYLKDYFSQNTTSWRIYKDPKIAYTLAELKSHIKSNSNELADEFLNNGILECDYAFKPHPESYKDPIKTQTCLINCSYINSFPATVANIKRSEKRKIAESIHKLKNIYTGQ
jgi:lipopolysaccharide export LptBFGC system permease protein LptF